MNEPSPDEAAIWLALRLIDDPEFGINLVDLGLIYRVACERGEVHVVMTLTTEACPSGLWIYEGVKALLAQVPGVTAVRVDLVFSPAWTPERLSQTARSALGFSY